MPHFFLSSAVGDDDRYVEEFFLDLRTEVAALTGDERDVGHLGAVAHQTDTWPDGMAAALSGCRVFVALCSPRYFLNQTCGRQWWVFAERLRHYEEDTGEQAPALIQVMWAAGPAPGALVPDARAPHRGLRQFVRLRGLREQYRAFVAALAERIVATARAHPLPHHGLVPELALTPTAFAVADLRAPAPAGVLPAGSAVAAVAAGPMAAGPAGSGAPAGTPPTPYARWTEPPQQVHFVVAAGSRQEMDQVREDIGFYGDSPMDWAPYRPAATAPLAGRAQGVAAGRRFGSDVVEISQVLARIEQARADNEIVVLLVDPWTTRIEAYRRILAEVDRRGLAETAVLVPASRADDETRRNQGDLRFGLSDTFRNSVGRPDALLRTGIETPDGFDVSLANVLEEARNRMFREAEVHRVPPGEAPRKRPILRSR